MTRLSKNFKRKEFQCPCCDVDTVDAQLIEILQRLRDHFEKRVVVTSGSRCNAYNEKIGGGKKSQHLTGRAADIAVQDVPTAIVQELLEDWNVPGLGCYDNFTHVDTRTGYARWNMRTDR